MHLTLNYSYLILLPIAVIVFVSFRTYFHLRKHNVQHRSKVVDVFLGYCISLEEYARIHSNSEKELKETRLAQLFFLRQAFRYDSKLTFEKLSDLNNEKKLLDQSLVLEALNIGRADFGHVTNLNQFSTSRKFLGIRFETHGPACTCSYCRGQGRINKLFGATFSSGKNVWNVIYYRPTGFVMKRYLRWTWLNLGKK